MNNTGRSSFPLHVHNWYEEDSSEECLAHDAIGMTLRDYFAAQAVKVLMQGNVFDIAAKRAYALADAMMRVRDL